MDDSFPFIIHHDFQQLPQVGSRHDGLVSVVTEFGVNVVLGDARGGRGHEGGNFMSESLANVANLMKLVKCLADW